MKTNPSDAPRESAPNGEIAYDNAAPAADPLGFVRGPPLLVETPLVETPARGGAFVRRVVNTSLAIVLILIGLPLFIAIGLLIVAVDGRPLLHRGERLGRRKRPFTMYKFRTLAHDASQVIGDNLLSFRHWVVIPCGNFLRDTRLDELPQLFNILKGDMTFVGPRPVGPAVYENLCRHLSQYDRQFAVKPGLVGFSQLFTPHSSPKRLRTLVDNRELQTASSRPFREAVLVACAVLAVTRTTVRKISRYIWYNVLQAIVLRLYRNRRNWRRVQPRNSGVLIELDGAPDSDLDGGRTIAARLVDINRSAFLLRCPERLPEGSAPLRLTIKVRFRRRPRASTMKTRIARCTGWVPQTRAGTGSWNHVIMYAPVTDWSQYLVDQYLLRGSLVDPFRSRGTESGLEADGEGR